MLSKIESTPVPGIFLKCSSDPVETHWAQGLLVSCAAGFRAAAVSRRGTLGLAAHPRLLGLLGYFRHLSHRQASEGADLPDGLSAQTAASPQTILVRDEIQETSAAHVAGPATSARQGA